jgi:transketolase
MVTVAKASHIGSAFSIADIVAVLYGGVMKIAPSNPALLGRDRFILSKGHACTAVYAALAETGFFPIKDLQQYGQDDSLLMSHINSKVPGVEFSTGALGHGLPFGVGKALAGKIRAEDWRTFVLLSDGEMDEGSNWEALMFAAHHRLDNLVAIIDYNKLQSLDSVAATLGLEPLVGKLEAFGWAVREVDGHDHAALRGALGATPWEVGKPSIVVAHTIKGKGVAEMEGKVAWHYRNPTIDQLADMLAELG